MLTHWESSKKPLFIKMVWKNGQHHALLKKEQSTENLKLNTSNFNQKTTRMTKSAVNKIPSNLNISSVKLLDSARQSASYSARQSTCQTRNSARMCKTPTTFREKSNLVKKNSSIKKIAEENSLQTNINKNDEKLDLTITPTNIEINDPNQTKRETSSTFSCLNINTDIPNNSLSERVMVWLDLATQMENCSQSLQKVASNPTIEKKSHIFAKHKKSFSSSLDIDHFYKRRKSEFYIEGINVNVQLPKSIFSNQDIENENCVNFTQINSFADSYFKEPLVSSESEENVSVDINEDVLPKKIFMKRQLHVFIPSLGKKISDCDTSLFSSSLSNYSITQRYI